MGYPMVDEDTLRINSPFGFLTSTADKALKTYMGMKEGHRKAETDIAKAILEGLIKRDDTQMRGDLPQGMNFQDPSQIAGMFEPKPKELSMAETISAKTFGQEYGTDPITGQPVAPITGGRKSVESAQKDRSLDLTSRGLDLEAMRIKLEKARVNKADKEKEPTFFDFHKLADEYAQSVVGARAEAEKADAKAKEWDYIPDSRQQKEMYDSAYKDALGKYQAVNWLLKNGGANTDNNIKAVRQKFGW